MISNWITTWSLVGHSCALSESPGRTRTFWEGRCAKIDIHKERIAWYSVGMDPGQTRSVNKVKTMGQKGQVNQWRGTTVRYTSGNSGGHICLNVVLILHIEAKHQDSQRQWAGPHCFCIFMLFLGACTNTSLLLMEGGWGNFNNAWICE